MRVLLALALLIGGLVGPAVADEYSLDNRAPLVFSGRGGPARHISPYPMSNRAAEILTTRACWRGCEANCGARFYQCLPAQGSDACRSGLDRCGRACVVDCRISGGPLLYSFE